ncbi:chromate transporter [Anaerotalea alkaliphila]|uniref:Chromate transporter n=1 Tax=Anaerotalea alkaliphila TaxID=2662126 RepID=A0A7X5HU28_9FIRM|nr:chromate transporter [Anaerotalea alkaliphila]NDL66673.1 chromate transporter [Anaerotalea alkaliphila]
MLVRLVLEFLGIGLFTYGGGLAMLVLLQDRAEELQWMGPAQFADMIAISQSTPGPIAINLATFVGVVQGGVAGAVAASIAVCVPGVLISLLVSRFLQTFAENPTVVHLLKGIRALVVGLIAMAVFQIAKISILVPEGQGGGLLGIFHPVSLVLLGVFVYGIARWDKHPLVYILLGGVLGVLAY